MLFPLAGGSGAVIKLGELLMILDLHRQGLSVSAIARHLCSDRKTVRSAIAKWLERPKYIPRPPWARITDPFEPYLKERQTHYCARIYNPDTGVAADTTPVFTCSGSANLGLLKNPRDAFYYETTPPSRSG
jgi:hypothetical protein